MSSWIPTTKNNINFISLWANICILVTSYWLSYLFSALVMRKQPRTHTSPPTQLNPSCIRVSHCTWHSLDCACLHWTRTEGFRSPAPPLPGVGWGLKLCGEDWHQDSLNCGLPGADKNSGRRRHTGMEPTRLELANWRAGKHRLTI